MGEIIKGVAQATELEAVASRLRKTARASSWLHDHAHKWDGAVTEINMRGHATGVEGYAEAMEIMEEAIAVVHADILAAAIRIADLRSEEVRNTVRLIADNLEGR